MNEIDTNSTEMSPLPFVKTTEGSSVIPGWQTNCILALSLWFTGMGLVDGDAELWLPAIMLLGFSTHLVLKRSGSNSMSAMLISSAVVMTMLVYGVVASVL